MAEITVVADADSLADAAAQYFVERAREAIAQHGRFAVALSGGSTPRAMFARLAAAPMRDAVDWPRVHVFWGDERMVGPEDEASNFRMARETLLDAVSLPAANIHRIRGEDRPPLAALACELDLRDFFRTPRAPVFDLVLLGLGDNGHTASLFPGTAALRETERLAVAQYVEVVAQWRVTFTVPLINAAAHIAFLVAGAGKADVLRRVLDGPYDPDVLPAQLIQPRDGALLWLVDAAAADGLSLRGGR